MNLCRTKLGELRFDDFGDPSSLSGLPSHDLTYPLVKEPRPVRPLFTESDAMKICRVMRWQTVEEPVLGTCRNCGHRSLLLGPCVGLYEGNKLLRSEDTDLVVTPLSYQTKFSSGDINKMAHVTEWVSISNPVIGVCRRCLHKGIVDDPCIGLY